LTRIFEEELFAYRGISLTWWMGAICFIGVAMLGIGESYLVYHRGDSMIIRGLNAHIVPYGHNSVLDQSVDEITKISGLPRPAIFQINLDSLNACSLGRDPQNASIIVTLGTSTLLDRGELRAVIAHEMAHIKNRDILSNTVLAALAGGKIFSWRPLFRWLSDNMVRVILAYILSIAPVVFLLLWNFGYIQPDPALFPYYLSLVLAVGLYSMRRMLLLGVFVRDREHLADLQAVEITGTPEGLINAYEKFKIASNIVVGTTVATSSLFLEYPKYRGQRPFWLKIQPSIDARLEKLRHVPKMPVKVQDYISEGAS
jgi:heat shock protein HtpX